MARHDMLRGMERGRRGIRSPGDWFCFELLNLSRSCSRPDCSWGLVATVPNPVQDSDGPLTHPLQLQMSSPARLDYRHPQLRGGLNVNIVGVVQTLTPDRRCGPGETRTCSCCAFPGSSRIFKPSSLNSQICAFGCYLRCPGREM